jgi:amino acid transporter
MPGSGGSYVFLREAYQYWTGRLIPFLFVWSTLLVTPLIMSTGMIGMAQYLAFFWPGMTTLETQLAAVAFTVVTVALLYRRIDSVATITKVLWAGMIVTVLIVIVTAATHFNAHRAFDFPPGALGLTPTFFAGLGAGLVIAIYDYLGYYTSAYLGDEVARPGYVIPRSIILAIVGVAIIDLSMNIGIISVVPWPAAARSTAIATLFMQRVWGRPGAAILTLLILWTAFASVYTGLLGASRLPYNAARDGLFLRSFARLHPRLHFPHLSLLVMGVITAGACFFSLQTIINALIALSIVVQFIGQVLALTILRIKQPRLKRPFRQWLYPLPSLVALVGWIYIFWSSGWQAISLAIIWTGVGIVVYLVWAYYEKVWPFHKIEVREVYVEQQERSNGRSALSS